ncbi:MAG TPA: hypothetical protein VIO39_00725 [Methylotenera sp.]
MIEDFKRELESVEQELEADKNKPLNKAIREIMGVERQYYYNKGSNQQRVKDVRTIIAKFSG